MKNNIKITNMKKRGIGQATIRKIKDFFNSEYDNILGNRVGDNKAKDLGFESKTEMYNNLNKIYQHYKNLKFVPNFNTKIELKQQVNDTIDKIHKKKVDKFVKKQKNKHEAKKEQKAASTIQKYFRKYQSENMYIMNVYFTINVKYKGSNKIYQVTKSYLGIKVTKSNYKQKLEEAVASMEAELDAESGITWFDIKKVEHELIKVNNTPDKMENVKMKYAGALLIDGDPSQEWDTKTGKCVFDFIIHTYGDIKGFKTICNYEKLNHIFRDWDDVEDRYIYEDALINGVSTNQIQLFCEKTNIAMYALDQDEFYFKKFTPIKRDHHAPSLIFKVVNNHFYPVLDQTRRKSLIKSISNDIQQSDVVRKSKADLNEVKMKDYEQVVNLEDVPNPKEFLIKVMVEKGKQPQNKNISFDGEIKGFEIDKVRYNINCDVENIREIYNNMNIEYNGQTINTLLFDIIEKIAKIKIPKSSPNPYVYKTLTNEGVKNRIHYGFVNHHNVLSLNKNNLLSLDIKRCYSACMNDPYDDFMLFDFNDTWENFNEVDKLKLGLYYVKTNDYTMLHGNNIYSRSILEKAKEERISFTIIKQLIPSNSAPKTLFQPILDAIKISCGKNEDMVKKLNNMLSGYLGKTKKKVYKVHIDSNITSFWHYMKKEGENNGNIFCEELKLDDERKTYFYGQQFDITLSEMNLPIYIQIKDFANMRLYDMIKSVGGYEKLILRKVDCAVLQTTIPPKISNEWGGYRHCEIPKCLSQEKSKAIKFEEEPEWINYKYNDSNNWEDILKVAIEHKGLLIKGRAGVGKSYVIKQIEKQITRLRKLSFTNKAALNINGITIHKFLKMDDEGKISWDTLQFVKQSLDFIIIDEISMIPKYIWKRLVELKKATGVIFILLGDYRQCPPVENEKIEDYFNHPGVKYLANFNQLELTVRRRYDQELWDILEDVNNVDCSKFGNKLCDRNICYFNRTRKYVNDILMRKYKPQNSIYLPRDPKDEYTQNTYLYIGLPIIGRVTWKNGELINNECYTITEIDNKFITCENIRPDEEGNPEKHIIKIKIKDFHHNFLVNYCATTHKSQGETIAEDITIWDWDRMSTKLKYTAMSRVKLPSQINFMNVAFLDKYIKPKNLKQKIESYKETDAKKGLKNDIDEEYIIGLIEKQNHMCHHCHKDLLVDDYERKGEKQYSVDRVNDSIGHTKTNVVISCWECNRKHTNIFL